MKAYIVHGKGDARLETVATPKPGPGEIVVKVSHVALNPSDWKVLDWFGSVGATLGSDFLGAVVEKGPDADEVQVGDRVASCIRGGIDKGVGAFAEYLVTRAKAVLVVPAWINDADGANFGVAGFTAYLGVYQSKHLGLPLPTLPLKSMPPVDRSRKVLVWSGATSVGQYAVQFARAAGAYVITTSSPKNNEFLTSLGASEVFDYHDEEAPEKIAAAHPDLVLAYDTYSENGSQEACARALSKEKPSTLIVILPRSPEVDKVNPKVRVSVLMVYSTRGEETEALGTKYSKEYCEEDYHYLHRMLSGKHGDVYRMFEHGAVKPNRATVLPGGLDQVLVGLDRQRKGQVSAEKLTYKIA